MGDIYNRTESEPFLCHSETLNPGSCPLKFKGIAPPLQSLTSTGMPGYFLLGLQCAPKETVTK